MIPTNAVAGVRLVVLSAGLSARLGSPKALARIRGVTLLRRTLRTVAPLAAARVIVVSAAEGGPGARRTARPSA